jgi:hypothetical protein
MDVDINQILSAFIGASTGGGAVYAAIKVEIKFLWRDLERLRVRFEEKLG